MLTNKWFAAATVRPDAGNPQCRWRGIEPEKGFRMPYRQPTRSAWTRSRTPRWLSHAAGGLLAFFLVHSAAAQNVDGVAAGLSLSSPAPRVGQTVTFTLTAQNLGTADITAAGDLRLIQDFNTDNSAGSVAFGDITPSGADFSCAVAGSAVAGEPALPAGQVRVRCSNSAPVHAGASRNVSVSARVLKPALMPASGNVYTAQSTTLRVLLNAALCEFKTETSSNPSVSAVCNDAAASSNNHFDLGFDVPVPLIDLQLRKAAVIPGGQSNFTLGQNMRYRFRIQNLGPSRAEAVVLTDRLTVPAFYTLATPTVLNVNGVAAEGGFMLDASKAASVRCTQAAANADVVCVLDNTAANNTLAAGAEVNFEVELVPAGATNLPPTFSNEGLVCADETAVYESNGACSRAPGGSNNNLAAASDIVYACTDWSIVKTTVTPGPVSVNQPVEYRLVLRNLDCSTTPRLRVQDLLPENFELVTSGANAPSVTLGSFVTAAPSTVTGASLACTPTPATLTAPNQAQTVNCNIESTPGPLGASGFPGSTNANNTLTIRLVAVPRDPYYTGPFLLDRSNTATVSVGLDDGGNPLSVDLVPGNNSSSSVIQVANSSLAGRVFNDLNGNGLQDGSSPGLDEGIGNVTLALSGTDAFGNAVLRTTTTSNTVGATRGDYVFDNLPRGTYTLTQTQPAGYANSAGTPPAPSAGGTYTAAASASTSTYSGVVLPLAAVGSGYNFPEMLPGAVITGTVYNDRDRSGTQNGSEPGIPDVTLGLYPGGSSCPASGSLPGGALQTVLSNASGAYSFTPVVSGNSYVICQQQPTSHGDITPLPGSGNSTPGANQINVPNLPSTGSAGNDYPEALAGISGTVFVDVSGTAANNNNGVQNAGEPGLGSALAGAGVPITLTGTLSSNGSAVAPLTVTTAADGSWRFDDLLPGTYTVSEGPIPAALGSFNDGINTAGSVAGGGSAGTAGTVGDNAIRGISLAAAGISTGNTFAELPRAAIRGLVYIDANRDSALTAADSGRLGGVTIELRQGGNSCASAALLGSTVTAADGSYNFPGGSVSAAQLLAGLNYRVCQLQPTAWGDGATNPGPGATSPAANEIALNNLPASGSANNNFGEFAASLAGSVYRDFGSGTAANDDNGVRNAGELGIAGVPITLLNSGNGASVVLNTDSRGNYSFTDLPTGTYTLSEGAIPAASGSFANGRTTAGTVNGAAAGIAGNDTITAIALPAGGLGLNHNFGELNPAAGISGTVYIDRNRDGLLSAADPGRLPGVSLRLVDGISCAGNVLATVLTDAAGNYTITNANLTAPAQLASGRPYSICETQPVGYGEGSVNPGTGGSTPGANQIVIASLPAAGSSNNNFGERAGSLAGRVFLDAANDGLFNASDSGIGGVVMTLSGGASGLTTTTAADGSWRFDDLVAGSYDVVEQAAQPSVSVAGVNVTTLNGQTRPGNVAGVPSGTATPVATTPSAVRGITLAAAADSVNHDFAEILPSQVSGSVYDDSNSDGTRQPLEAGFVGQPIVLTGTDDQAQPVSLNTNTDSTGTFSFPSLRPGSYTLTQPNQPAGTVGGITTPGSAGGTATAVVTTPSVIGGFALLPGQSSTGNLFGEGGNSPDVVVSKTNSPSSFTENNPGSYTLTVRNSGPLPTTGVYTVTDTLPAGLSVVPATPLAPNPRGVGWVCSVAGQVVTCTSSDVIGAGGSNPNPITLDVLVARGACTTLPCTLNNRVSVIGGGETPPRTPQPPELANPPLCTAPLPTQNVCLRPTPVQQAGGVSGTVWLDLNHDRSLNAGDVRKPGFLVEVLSPSGVLERTAITDAQGNYMVQNLVPGIGYEVRFRDPVTGAYYGNPVSADPAGGNDPRALAPRGVVPAGSIQNITVPGNDAVRINQSLPLDPTGVVYDSASRLPIAGAVVELLGPAGDPLPGACVLGGTSRLVTATSGTGVVPGGYGFWLISPAAAGCPGNGNYQLRVTPPAGYLNSGRPSDGSPDFTSPTLPAAAPALAIPANCQAFSPGSPCVVQNQATPPQGAQPTPYFFRLPFSPNAPNAPGGVANVVGNHIPLDPFGGTRFVISKQASTAKAEVGDPVRYTVVVRHVEGPALPNVRVDDSLPAGFRYVGGTFRINNVLQSDPAGSPGPRLSFALGSLPINGQITFTYVLRVGAGAQQGDGINSAQGVSSNGAQELRSNVARAKVQVVGGVFSNEACVAGKVYVDCNNNMVQDREELGIPGVRLVLQDGTTIATDSEGKYSFCGLPPRTHVLKLDALSMPRGSRIVTSSSRNAGDGHSIFLDPKNGELHRADFIEGSCSNTVLEQVKARRSQGEVRAVETEKTGSPALKFEGKAPGYPQQGTDSANQAPVKPREPAPNPSPPVTPSRPEQNTPVPQLPAASQNTQRK